MKSKKNAASPTQNRSGNKKNFTETWQKITHNKFSTIFILLIIVINFASNYSAIFDRKINLNGDNIYYFSLGKALSDGKGYTNTMFLTETKHTHFPPGYSLFLAAFMKVFPDNIIAVKLLNGFLLLATAVLLFFLIRKITKNVILALCVALLSCMQASILDFSTMMMSEMLFMFVTSLCIYLAILLNERSLFIKKHTFNYILLFLLFFFSIYSYFVRTVGTALVLSLILWFAVFAGQSFLNWKKAKKNSDSEEMIRSNKFWFIQRIGISVFLIVAFFAANHLWTERNYAAGKKSGAYVGEFTKKGGGERMETIGDWVTRIKNNMVNFTAKWVPNALFNMEYDNNPPTAKQWIVGCLVVLMLFFGLTGIGNAGLLLLFYVGGTFAVLLFFPEQFQGTRYIVALIPWLIFLFLNGLCRAIFYIGKFVAPKYNTFVLQSCTIVLFSLFYLYPTYLKSQENLREVAKYTSWGKYNNRPMNDYIDAIKWSSANLPDSSSIICRKPEIYYMFSDFKKAGGFPQYADVDTMYNLLVNQNINYLIIDSWFRHAYVTLYPVVQKHPEKFKIVHQIGSVDTVNNINPTLILEFNPKWGYTGEMKDGKREGQGQLVMQNGLTYKGSFKDGEVSGYGELIDTAGNVLSKGIWERGALIRPQ